MTALPTTTIDGLLNKRVMLEQPANGYRIAVDTVFLAAAVAAQAGQRVLDMGCGVGGVMICLAGRVAGVTGVGIDIQPDLVELCRRNIARNACAAGLEAREGDVTRLTDDHAGGFDHVMANPPYHDEGKHDVSPDAARQVANSEKSGDLDLWIRAAATALKSDGCLTMIHRADRQAEILFHLQGAFGAVEILPLVSKEGADPKRIILRARKGGGHAVVTCRALVVNKPEGGYTFKADAVLRNAQELEFQSP